jgi:hypothetical protein
VQDTRARRAGKRRTRVASLKRPHGGTTGAGSARLSRACSFRASCLSLLVARLLVCSDSVSRIITSCIHFDLGVSERVCARASRKSRAAVSETAQHNHSGCGCPDSWIGRLLHAQTIGCCPITILVGSYWCWYTPLPSSPCHGAIHEWPACCQPMRCSLSPPCCSWQQQQLSRVEM